MADALAEDVRRGLTAPRKFLLPQYFYDALGSALFTAICELPEYYVTRAETEILTTHADEIAESLRPPVRLVELGSGSGKKTRILIEALLARQPELEYAPLDIDPHILELSARELTNTYSRLKVTPLVGDFRDARPALAETGGAAESLPRSAAKPSAEALPSHAPARRRVVLFLGSTIGNLDPDDAAAMLMNLRAALRAGDALFLGADLRKPASVLIPAYDDPLGVTAAFNKNILVRINRELGANFDLAQFEHRASWDETLGRIEMHLVSRIAQSVRIEALGIDVEFAHGESIHTENSHKYDEAALRDLAARGGFQVERIWKDSRSWFADLLLKV